MICEAWYFFSESDLSLELPLLFLQTPSIHYLVCNWMHSLLSFSCINLTMGWNHFWSCILFLHSCVFPLHTDANKIEGTSIQIVLRKSTKVSKSKAKQYWKSLKMPNKTRQIAPSFNKGQNTWLKVYLNDKWVRAAMRDKTVKLSCLDFEK